MSLDNIGDFLTPDVMNKLKRPGIAGPQIASVNAPANLPGVLTAAAPSAAAPAPAMPPPPMPASSMPASSNGAPLPEARSMIGPSANSLQTQVDLKRQADLNRGSGIDQFSQRHPIGGGFLRALDIAGSVFAPNLARAIPGTTMHHNMLVGENRGALKTDFSDQEQQARTAHEQAETDALKNPKPAKPDNPEAAAYEVLSDPDSTPDQRQKAQAALEQVKSAGKEDKGLANPQAGYSQAIAEALKAGRDPNTDAHVLAWKSAIENVAKEPKEPNTAEGIRAKIAAAHEAGNTAEEKRLQGELKAVGDPYAQQKLNIQVQAGTDRHDAAQDKKTEALAKQTRPLQNTIDEAETAHNLQKMAESGNASADVDLALSFFKIMRGNGGQGIRFTQQEQNLIMGARNSAGDLQAFAQKVIGGGQKFTPEQRKQIVDVIDMHARAAQMAMERMKGGGEQAAEPASGGNHMITVNGKQYRYKGSGATDDMGSYDEVKK